MAKGKEEGGSLFNVVRSRDRLEDMPDRPLTEEEGDEVSDLFMRISSRNRLIRSSIKGWQKKWVDSGDPRAGHMMLRILRDLDKMGMLREPRKKTQGGKTQRESSPS